jgi:hypothetical protein
VIKNIACLAILDNMFFVTACLKIKAGNLFQDNRIDKNAGSG